MKRAWQATGLLTVIVALGMFSGRVSFGRVTTAASDDIWCVGPSGAEVCVDASGDLLPTTDNDTTLGTSSLRWSDVQTLDITVGDDATISGDLTLTGALAMSGLQNLAKTQVGTIGSAAGGMTVSSGIPVTTNYQTLISTGGSITITDTPSVSTTTILDGTTELTSGTFLILTSTAANGPILLQDEGTLTGSQLQLGAATRSIGQYDTLILIYDALDNFWREVAFVNN